MKFSAQCKAVEELLEEFFNNIEIPADLLLRKYLKERRYIGSHDRQKMTSIFYGTLRHYFRLRFILKLDNLPPLPRWLILCYLIDQEGKTPSDLEKEFQVLQKYGWQSLTEKHILFLKNIAKNCRKLEKKDMLPVEAKYGISTDTFKIFEKNILSKDLENILHALQEEAPTDIRVNPLKKNREQMLLLLKSKKWEADLTPISPLGIRLKKRYPVTTTDWFKDGLIEIQDEGAQILSFLGQKQAPKKVLDYCAGAGGKSILIGALMENKGQLILTDTNENRLKEAAKRCKRAGLSNHMIKPLEKNKSWFKRQKESFDLVLVDVPCSGTGTWRRHVDAKIKFNRIFLDQLLAEQSKILERAAQFVKSGGLLIYATCSILTEENEDQILSFLKNNSSFRAVAARDYLPFKLSSSCLEQEYIKILPQHKKSDGFFAAVLKKA